MCFAPPGGWGWVWLAGVQAVFGSHGANCSPSGAISLIHKHPPGSLLVSPMQPAIEGESCECLPCRPPWAAKEAEVAPVPWVAKAFMFEPHLTPTPERGSDTAHPGSHRSQRLRPQSHQTAPTSITSHKWWSPGYPHFGLVNLKVGVSYGLPSGLLNP